MTAEPRSRISRLVVILIATMGLAALALVPANVGAQEDPEPLDVSLNPPFAGEGMTVSVKVEGDVCAAATAGSLQVTAGQPDEVVLYEIPFADDLNNTNFVVQEVPEESVGAPLSVVVTCTDAAGAARAGSAPLEFDMPVNGFTIIKDVSGGTSPQVFTFTVQSPPGHPVIGPATASDGGSVPNSFGAAQIDTGRYAVTESTITGWQLTSITCDDGTAIGDLATRSVSFELSDDTHVTCTFVNTQIATQAPSPAQPAYTG